MDWNPDVIGKLLIGGIEKVSICISEYDARWPALFEDHDTRIRTALEGRALRVAHIGSTSVPGLAAKPIVDILLVVADSSDESTYLPALEYAGYKLRVREPDFHEHRMVRTPERDAHVHVYSDGCPEIDRCLAFRDRLRQHEDERKLYEEVKRTLAQQSWPDMNAYAAAKTEVIEKILASRNHHVSNT